MNIFAKFCCIVGQIVVGAIIGLLWAKYVYRLIDWIYDTIENLANKWKMRKFEADFESE